MLFRNYRENFFVSNTKYLSKWTSVIGTITSYKDENNIMPSNSSASTSSYTKAIKRFYSEHLDRLSLAGVYKSCETILAFDICRDEFLKVKAKDLSFGISTWKMYIDTTGVATHPNSSKLCVKKALSELIEKNDLFYFWYLKFGARVTITAEIESWIKKLGLGYLNIYLYKSNYHSSWTTIICFAFKEEHLRATGIACDESFIESIVSALNETRIIRMLNSFTGNKMFEKWNFLCEADLQTMFNDHKMRFCRERKYELKYYNLSLNKDVKNLYIVLLKSERSKTVSVISPDLLKSLPTHDNLNKSKNSRIVSEIGIDFIMEQLDCPVL